jgi:hypothetical protein
MIYVLRCKRNDQFDMIRARRATGTAAGRPAWIGPTVSKSAPHERHCHGGVYFPPQPTKERVMQYMLLIYRNETAVLSASKEVTSQLMAAYSAYTEAMKKAGVYIGGNRLQPTSSATTVRAPNGKSSVLDGPYAETKEQLGGYYMIEAPDLDAALTWAARCPGAAHGAIEVRPLWVM